jgi:hypothetical protein
MSRLFRKICPRMSGTVFDVIVLPHTPPHMEQDTTRALHSLAGIFHFYFLTGTISLK